MQATSDGPARALRARLAAGLALCALSSSAFAQDDPTLLRRALHVGTTEAVRAKAAAAISPHLGKFLASGSEAAEFAEPPPPCGLDVYHWFGRTVKERFQVATLGVCRVSPTRVGCPTAYLVGYNRVYLVLDYRHPSAKEMLIAIDAKERAPEGQVMPGVGTLSRHDQLAIGDIFDAVLNAAFYGGRREKH